MKLPISLRDKSEWTLVGPMGPLLPATLSDYCVFGIDGGARFASKLDLWLGDGDSAPQLIPTPQRIHVPRAKNKSDLACALEILPRHPLTLHLWGFVGGRKDHELFVIGECLRFLDSSPGSSLSLYNAGAPLFTLYAAGEWKYDHQGLFSLGAAKEVQVELTGNVLYPISPPSTLEPLSSLGLSNEASGTIHLKNSGPVFLYYPEHS